jgi:hypothetical protein
MNKILEAEDILGDAKVCIDCVFLAMNELEPEQSGPLQAVADIASKKIDEAIALLDKFRVDMGVPDHQSTGLHEKNQPDCTKKTSMAGIAVELISNRAIRHNVRQAWTRVPAHWLEARSFAVANFKKKFWRAGFHWN